MGQQFFWLWLLLWSLLCFDAQGFPVLRAKRSHEDTELVHISVHPTEPVQPSLDREEEHGKKEENIVNKLVVLLKEAVNKIPTQRPTEEPPLITFHLGPSPPETADTIWVNRKPKNSEASPSTDNIPKTTTPFWRVRNDSVATIILHTETTPSTATTPELLKSESSPSTAAHSHNTISETPMTTVSLQLEKVVITSGKRKPLNRLTKGTLSKLVASLKKIDEVHGLLHKGTDKPQQEGNQEKHMEGYQHKPEAAHNLELINKMMKTIKNSPPSVRNDPALQNNIEKAERLLQADLKLVGEAEKRLKEAKDQEEKERQISPPPLPNLPGSEKTIMLMPVFSTQGQEEKQEQQISPSPPAHLAVSDATTLLVSVSPDQEEEMKQGQQISPSLPLHLTASDATALLVSVSPDQEEKMEQGQQISPSPPPHLTASGATVQLTTSFSDSLAKKAEEAQVKNGEFQSLIKLLYGLNGNAENPPNTKAEREMVSKTIVALDAMKTMSSGKADKSKRMLKQLFKKDTALAEQDIQKS